MKAKNLYLVVLVSSLMVPGLFAGTEIMESKVQSSTLIPYGYQAGLPLVDDDEITSPWSEYTVTSDDLQPGEVLYDPVVGRRFRVPEDI